jgi:predicted lipoprotein with Yx(FWY)xxD motif
MKKLLIVLILAVAVIGIAYTYKNAMKQSPTYDQTGANGNQTTTNNNQTTKTVSVNIARNQMYGNILADSNGRTLYMFMKDDLNKSNCYNQCATNWPPLIAESAPSAGEGVASSLLSLTTRTDGKQQVTYNGKPLYYWINDKANGDTNGQNVNKVWFVVTADGAPIQTDVVVSVTSSSKFGKILVDGTGWTLYMFTVDATNTSKCYGDCAQKWPPLLTVGKPVAAPGTTASLISTTKRNDGTEQVTYNGLPLYYWWKDQKPGDTLGQDVGKVWYVMAPDGKIIK